ncbi:MAG: DUF3857 domain-containing protein [Bacteroidota bacterium]
MKRFSVLFCLVTSFSFIATTASTQKAPMKWGKVAEEQLQMTSYPQDTQANAVVLCEYGSYTFDFGQDLMYRVKVHRRVKILKRAGFDEGDVVLGYRKASGHSLTVKAQVIQPDGTKIEVSKKDMFDEQVYDDHYRKRIAFPNLQEGSIIEYEFRQSSPSIYKLPTWYFQEDIPVMHSELRIVMPEWFQYAEMVQGHEQLADFQEGKKVLQTRLGNVDADHRTYIAKNVPALRAEPHITTMRDYMMRVKFQLRSVDIPGSFYENVMTSWDDIAKDLIESEYFGAQYLKPRFAKDLIAAVQPSLMDAKDDKEKIARIYNYLAHNIAWNESYDYFKDENINKCFETKSANSAEFSFMMIALLRANDITAYPVLTSTRTYGKMFPIYPFTDQFNHTLVCALVGDKAILIDIPDRDRPSDLLRRNSLNRQGMIVSDNGTSQWIDITPSKQSDIIMANLTIDEEGIVKGDIQCNFKGYTALSERRKARSDKAGDHWAAAFGAQAVDASIANVKYENLDAVSKPFKEKMDCELSDLAQVVDDYIYMTPVFYSSFKESPFKLEERNFPIDFSHPINERIIVNVAVPEGYAVEDMPEPVNLTLADGAGKFLFSTSQPKEDMVQIVMNVQVKKLMFLPEEYAAVKNFFDIVAEKQQEQIVLRSTMEEE